MESETRSQNDEAALLLYLAGEMSTEQKVAIERRLAGDASFASACSRLKDADSWLSSSFDELDRSQPLPGTASSWQRRIGRLIRQWQVRQAQTVPTVVQGRSIGSWAYTAAAAILVVVGYTAYWGIRADRPSAIPSYSPIASIDPAPVDQPLAGPRTDPILDYDQQPLADAEREIHDLAEMSELRTSFQ